MDNIVNNIPFFKGNNSANKIFIPGKSAIKPSNLYLTRLKKDLYEKSGETSKVSIPVYQGTNINQYNPKLLLKAYANKQFIQNQINSNPELMEIVDLYGLNEINIQNLLNIADSHLTTTTMYALMIANNMGLSDNDKKLLEQACIFHDFGKLLIPDEIINKPYPLTADEKDVMDLHSELGYQLLKNTGLNDRVLNMIRNHHKNVSENTDLLGQILSVADIYSALREKRVYKAPLPVNTAMNILDQKAFNGEVSAEVVDSLAETEFFRK